MTNRTSVSGIILAGGAGRRVQGRDKGLLSWQGKPLVGHVAGRLRPQVDHLYISCNRNRKQYSQFAELLAEDTRVGFQGPLAGIETVIGRLASEYLVVVACDVPQLPGDLVQRLLEPLCPRSEDSPVISYANDGDRHQYLCAALHSSCLDTLPGFLATGNRTVRDWYQLHRTAIVNFSDQTKAFANHNYLTDIE